MAREKLVGFAVAHLLFLTKAGEAVAWIVERIQVKCFGWAHVGAKRAGGNRRSGRPLR